MKSWRLSSSFLKFEIVGSIQNDFPYDMYLQRYFGNGRRCENFEMESLHVPASWRHRRTPSVRVTVLGDFLSVTNWYGTGIIPLLISFGSGLITSVTPIPVNVAPYLARSFAPPSHSATHGSSRRIDPTAPTRRISIHTCTKTAYDKFLSKSIFTD